MAGTKSAIKNYAWPFTKELLGASGEAAVMAVKQMPAVAKAVVGGAAAVAWPLAATTWWRTLV